MNFNLGSEWVVPFAVASITWNVVITVAWLLIAQRAARAHERFARAIEESINRR